jgi:hypothetical protein
LLLEDLIDFLVMIRGSFSLRDNDLLFFLEGVFDLGLIVFLDDLLVIG